MLSFFCIPEVSDLFDFLFLTFYEKPANVNYECKMYISSVFLTTSGAGKL